MAVTWYESKITKIAPMSPGVHRFWLENPGITYQAGQFITMDLPIGDKRLQRWRSYSIAGAPAEGGDLELCIVRSAEGAGTRYLFEEVKEGDIIRWKGPDGSFTLPENIQKDLVLICTGTGIAPFRSMLRELQLTGASHRNIHLIFGTRTEADILYREELEQLAQEMPGFRFDIALSRQPDWTGYQGYLHQIYQKEYAISRPDITFMICGWSKMIDEAVAHLILDLGYDRTQVLYELYG